MDALLSHFFSSKVPWVLKQARVEVSFELQALLQKKKPSRDITVQLPLHNWAARSLVGLFGM
jgi:hypothetical protein